MQIRTRACRERRDKTRGDGGLCQNATVLSVKLAGNLTLPNFGFRSGMVGVAAVKKDCTSGNLIEQIADIYILIGVEVGRKTAYFILFGII